MSALALIAAATVGLMGVDGEAPADTEARAITQVLGMSPDDVRPIALDAQMQPWWEIGLRTATCAGMPGADLDEAVRAADAQLADLEAVAAVATLSGAVGAAHCSEAWVDPGALKVALEWWGHAAQEAGDEHAARTAYEQLAAADPGWRIRPPPGSGFEQLWDTVRSERAGVQLVTLAVHGGAREVRWDGSAVVQPTAKLEVAPGRHLLQWSDAGGAVQGAWVLVSGTATRAALVTSNRGDALALLAAGMESEAGRAALEQWLGALRKAHGLQELVVLVDDGKPRRGYRLNDEGLFAWSADLQTDFVMQPDRARILVGGGWLAASTFSFHYADVRVAAEVKIVGPLHVQLDLDLGISTITHPRSEEWDGGVVLLPGVGAGLALRKPVGLVQPFASVTAGLWSTPEFEPLQESLDGAELEEHSLVHTSEQPVTLRLFVDGGVDLVPAGRSLVVRVSGGAGYGLGLQVRTGVLIGARFGQ